MATTLAGPAGHGHAATGRGSDFAELMRQVRAAGLLQRRPRPPRQADLRYRCQSARSTRRTDAALERIN